MTRMFNDQGGLRRLKAELESKMPKALLDAHDHSSRHRQEILGSDLCGCFYCSKTFLPTEITEWTDEDQTAFCPKCGVDSVIGSASGLPITKKFLDEMSRHWF